MYPSPKQKILKSRSPSSVTLSGLRQRTLSSSASTNALPKVQRVKSLFVGQIGIGKRSLIQRKKTGQFLDGEVRSSSSSRFGFIGDKNDRRITISTDHVSSTPPPSHSERKRQRPMSSPRNRSPASSDEELVPRIPTTRRTVSATPTIPEEPMRQGQPAAFGFLGLLEPQETQKLAELEKKVKVKAVGYDLQATQRKQQVPWRVKVCSHFSDVSRLRQSTAVAFCFSVAQPISFDYIKRLLEEFTGHWTKHRHAVVLVGLQCDQEASVTAEDIHALCKKYSIRYFETSTRLNRGVAELFTALEHYLEFETLDYPRWMGQRGSLKDKMSAAILSRSVMRVKQQLMIDPNMPLAPVKHGWRMIHVAAWEGFFEFVYLFIQAAPQCLNVVDSQGFTPLMISARLGHADIVRFLLEYGAEVDLKDQDGNSALTTSNGIVYDILEKHKTIYERNQNVRTLSDVSLIVQSSGVLRDLDLSYCKLETLPLEIFDCCGRLARLNLAGNNIQNIDVAWKEVPHLQKLQLFGNRVQSIPESLVGLEELQWLDLRHNQLTGITPHIGQMSNLRRLYLSHNALTYLPSQIADLEKTIEILDIYRNPMSTLPAEVVPKIGDVHPTALSPLMNYLRHLSRGGKEEYNRVKVMFVGDGNVGKTSLFQCMWEKSRSRGSAPKLGRSSKDVLPSASPRDTIATDGIDIHAITMPLAGGKTMTWDCWDYAGQEIYYSTHQFFLSPRSVYLICFNLLERDLSKVEYWLNSVQSRARGSPVFLVGTHVDDKACTDEYVDEFISRLIRKIKPDRFRDKLGVPSVKGIHALSCRKRTGIRELIQDITEIVHKSRFVGQLYPSSWLKLENTLSALSGSAAPFLHWAEFKRIAIGCQIAEDSVAQAANFLHSAGALCYFDDARSGLNDIVILDPQFLTNVMSAVVTLKHRYGSDGTLMQKDMVHVWREFPTDIHETLMNLLEQFEIAYELPVASPAITESEKDAGKCPSEVAKPTHKYLIPCLLASDTPDLSSRWSIGISRPVFGLVFSRIYRFAFLPLGFFSRLFVRNLHLPNVVSPLYWAHGQLLCLKDAKALLRYNPSSYVLHLQVHGDRADVDSVQYSNAVRLLRILVENIENTIEGWYESRVNVFIPCSHCIMEGAYSQWEFALEECMEGISRGQSYVLCRNARKIRLDILAPDLSLSDLIGLRIPFQELTLTRVIGEGAFGVVYKALYHGEDVAVKQMLDESSVDNTSDSFSVSSYSLSYSEERAEMIFKAIEFQREVWLMSCLHHPNLCGLRGICTSPMAMVMDYLPYGDLFHLFSHREVANYDPQEDLAPENRAILHTWPMKLRLALDIAEGMSYLHGFEPPVIHRDLRTPNIFIAALDVNAPVCALVGDFGLSRLFASSMAGGNFNRNWLAPEVMKGEDYSEKMDVYSFGIVLWELLTLQRPFEEFDEQFEGKPASHFKEAVIAGLRPLIPFTTHPDFRELIEQCWHPEPAKRPSFKEVITRIRSLADDCGVFFDGAVWSVTQAETVAPFEQRLTLTPTDTVEVARLERQLSPPTRDSVQKMLLVENTVWCAMSQGLIYVYDTASAELVRTITTNSERLYSLEYVLDSVWVGDAEGVITAYSSKDYKKLFTNKEHSDVIRSIVQLKGEHYSSSDRKKSTVVWSGDLSGNIYVWKYTSRSKPKLRQKIKVGCVGSLFQYGDLMLAGTEANILLFDCQTGTSHGEFVGHTGLVTDITAYHGRIWSCSNDGTILVWEVEESQPVMPPLQAHSAKVFCLIEHAGYMWAGSFDKTVSVWDCESYQLMQELKIHSDGVRCLLSVSNSIWSGSLENDGSIAIWSCRDQPNWSIRVGGRDRF